MYVFRNSNLHSLRKNVNIEYIAFFSCYRVDRNFLTIPRTQFLKNRGGYLGSNFYCNNDVVRKLQGTPKLEDSQQITEQVFNFFKTIKMEDLGKAPEAVFWYSAISVLPFIIPPVSFFIFGYSPILGSMQLVYAGTLCSFAGGMNWGFSLPGTDHKPTWENLGWAVAPQLIGWMALLLPQAIGFLVAAGGLGLSTFVDLSTTNYPNWFKSIRLAITVPAVISLLLSLFLHVVN